MSHFLSRLVERARGTAPRVEPIVAPRFAPSPFEEVATEIAPQPPAASPGKSLEQSQPNEKSETPALPSTIEVETVPTQPDALRVSGEEELLVPVQKRANGEARPWESETSPNEPARRSVPQSAESSFVRQKKNGRILVPPVSHRPSDLTNRPNESAPHERPIVRVTIGRIEVRAAPAPLPPRKTPGPAQPSLTLDAYLKSRKEGAR